MVADGPVAEWADQDAPGPGRQRLANLCHPLVWFVGTLLVLTALAGLALSLRCEVALNDPLWLDELHTVWTSGADLESGWSDVSPRAAAGNQTPLYFWIQYLLNRECPVWFSGERLGFRGLSLIAGGLLILAGGMFVWFKTRSVAGAALTGLLLAVDEVQHFYCTEARPYECLALLGLLQAIALWWCWQSCGVLVVRLTALFLASWAVVMLHPAGALLVVAGLIAVAVRFGWIWRWPLSAGQGADARQCRVSPFAPRKERTFAERKSTLVAALPLIGSLALLAPHWPSLSQTVANRDLWASIAQPVAALLGLGLPIGLFVISATVIGLAGRGWRQDPSAKDAAGQAAFLTLLAALVALLVQVCHWSGLAPVALPRYQAAAWGLVPVALGLLTGAAARERMEWILPACIFVIFAHIPLPFCGSPETGWRTMRGTGAGVELFGHHPGMRFENWATVEDLLFRDSYQAGNQTGVPHMDADGLGIERPVFLLSNLLEDSLLRPSPSKIEQGTQLSLPGPLPSREEYFRFPIFSINRPWGMRVWPRTTLGRPRFTTDDFGLLRQSRFGYLVLRGDDATARDAIEELGELGSAASWTVHAVQLEQAGRNVVRVWRLTVRPVDQGGGTD
jgi:hypothetical protein